jgi:hypothetical protein
MRISAPDVRAKVDSTRHATATWLHHFADDLDALSLEDAAELLTSLQDRIAELRRDAEHIMSGQRRA